MPNPRPGAWALIFVLVASLLVPAGAGVALARKPRPTCSGWTDQFHPPATIRVLRKRGPNAGTVEVVDFWTYVATVLRAEYSSGGERSPNWMRIGAISVKQFAWYYTMFWRGGKTADGTCYDVRDSTADQIYAPERMENGLWVPANVPTPANFSAMAETWHISLRKWNVTKNSSRLFLSGYRSGKKRPCGTDAKGFKIMQKSLRDCTTKNLTFEEVVRRYYEPKLELVNVRDSDILADGGQWLGDVGVLTPNAGATDWRIYPGLVDGFGQPVVGSFAIDPTTILGHGSGDVTGDKLSELVILVGGGKLLVAPATGTGYGEPLAQDVPAGAPNEQMVVGDFNGDLLADVGLLRSTPTAPTPDLPATLVVLPGSTNGTFGAPLDWWRGALDLSTEQVMAGDVNGDGKADLIMRDGTAGVRYWVAPSFATCLDFSTHGPCMLSPGAGLDAEQLWFDQPGWVATDIKQAMSDFNRDGRDDIMVVARNGGSVGVYGLAANAAGGFDPAQLLWQGSMSLDDVVPVGLHVDADGLGDLAMLQRDGTGTLLFWLRSSPRSAAPATMTATTAYPDPLLNWSVSDNRPY